MKVVVTGYDGDPPIYKHPFLAFATYYGFQPWACRPHRPQTKGKMNGLFFVYFAKSAQTAERSLRWSTLNEVTVQWLAQTADVRFHHEIKTRPIDRFRRETHLLSLPRQTL